MKITPLLFFLFFINAQIALPTFQAVHKPHSTSSSSGTFTFTNCSATGKTGPTQSQVNSTYTSGNSLYNGVTINTQGIQEWTVPSNGTYTIQAWGAQGGAGAGQNSTDGGEGAKMQADFNLTSGTVLKIMVGQQPSSTSSGGGGGTFVVQSNNTALIIAGSGGGGPGSCCGSQVSGVNGTTSNSGTAGTGGGCTNGSGGSGGNGGSASGSYPAGAGGGGGSYSSSSTNTSNSSGVREGHGQVIITY